MSNPSFLADNAEQKMIKQDFRRRPTLKMPAINNAKLNSRCMTDFENSRSMIIVMTETRCTVCLHFLVVAVN